MTYQEEVVRNQVKSGGSSVLIWAMGIAAVGCLALFVSCGDDNHIINVPKHQHDKHCNHGKDKDNSSILYSFSVGEIYYNAHVDARIKIEDFSDGTVYVSIGINGSQQFTVEMRPEQVQKMFVDDPDWSLNVKSSEAEDK